MTKARLRMARILMCLLVVSVGLGCAGSEPAGSTVSADAAVDGGSVDPAKPMDSGLPVDDLDDLLEPMRANAGLPALAALVVKDGRVAGEGAVGVRKFGAAARVTRTDAWFLGSASQTMTATLAARLVEERLIDWSSSLGIVLADIPMHATYTSVTLASLLEHRGGAPRVLPPELLRAMHRDGAPQALREDAVRALLASTPDLVPGSQVLVSDAGYLMAAVMLERASRTSWEELLKKRLFDALGLSSCRYAVDPSDSPTDEAREPWGHTSTGAAPTPIRPDSDTEPPPAFGPAGRIRCSLTDWAKMCILHLSGARKEPAHLLSAASFETLQTPTSGTQAKGWSSVSRPWAGEVRALNQASRSNSHFALTWVLPARNATLIVVTNQANELALSTVDEVTGKLVERFLRR